MLVVMAGLPGSGKSTIARALGPKLPAVVISVDPIDAAMRRAGIGRDQPTGLAAYLAAEAVAHDVLNAGMSVVLDAVNAVEPARHQWRELAARCSVPMIFVEVICSDPHVHRARLTARCRELSGMPEPTWDDVVRRAAEYAPWTDRVLRLDSIDGQVVNVRAVLDVIAVDRTGADHAGAATVAHPPDGAGWVP